MTRQWSRRTILQSVGGAGLVGLVAGTPAALADEPASERKLKTRFGTPRALAPKVADLGDDLKATNISPDGQAISFLFDDATQLELSEKSDANIASLIASIELPVAAQPISLETFRGISSIARGFVTKDAATRVLLTIDLGGTLGTIEFPYGQAIEGLDFTRPFFSYPYLEERIKVVGEPQKDDGDDESPPSPPPHFAIILTITIQRRDPKDQALVHLASLDAEIVDATANGAGGEEKKPDGPPEKGYQRERRRKRG